MNSIYTLTSLCFGLIICTVLTSNAQQLSQYTQFSINPYLLNPALAGTEDFIDLKAGYRTQWSGFKDAPQTAYFSAHSSLNPGKLSYGKSSNTASRVALGLVLGFDKTGPLKQSNGTLTFAYNFALTRNGLRASVGFNIGMKRFTYQPEGYTENLVNQNDPSIQQSINKMLMDFGAGVWIYNEHLFIGASSFQFFNLDYSRVGTTPELIPGSAFLRHYFLMGGWNVKLGEEVSFVPSVLVKWVNGAPVSFDLNAKFVVEDNYWLGGNYRHEDSFAVFGGLLINDRLSISYSFDFVLSNIRNASSGSNEIHIGYRIFHKQGIVCPSRFW